MKTVLKFLVIILFCFCILNSPCISMEYKVWRSCPNYSLIESPDARDYGILLNDGTVFIYPSDKELEIPSYDPCNPEFKYNNRTYYVTKDSKGYDITNYKPVTSISGIVIVNGKYGVLDRSYDIQNFILEPKYDYIKYLDDYYVKVKKGDRYALFNVITQKLSNFEYKDVKIVKKGKFSNFAGLTHYYVKKKTKLGWQYTSFDVYREMPKRFFEDTVLYYGLGGFIWDSIP